MAIAYLSTMEKGARDKSIRESFHLRIIAFKRALLIEKAQGRFIADHGQRPSAIQDLVLAGYLKEIPVDPYGGKFYLEPDGSVNTTSKFAFAGVMNH